MYSLGSSPNIFHSHRILSVFILLFAISDSAWTKDVDVPGDFSSIQEAIDAINNDPLLGDTIVVDPGTYRENITLISDITLRGRETARTILEPDLLQPIITASGITNTRVQNFTFSKAETAIRISNSTQLTISSNVFALDQPGIAIDVTDDSPVLVSNNTFHDNGIAVSRSSNDVQISNNIFSLNTVTSLPASLSDNINYNCFINNEIDLPLGSNAVVEDDALFANSALGDFHLRQGSPCIDQGQGSDIIDDTDADLGAYGGEFADALPFPIQNISSRDISAAAGNLSIEVSWSANLSYLITNTDNPGSYQVYYDSDAPGPPYDGTDAGSGSLPSPINAGNVTLFTLSDLSPAINVPAAPVITNVDPSNQRIKIRWNPVSNAVRYKVYYGINNVTENQVEVGNTTDYTLTGLQNGISYLVAVTAVAQAIYYVNIRATDNTGDSEHISAFGTESSIAIGDSLESELSETFSAIPEEVLAFPFLPGNNQCFIATAANSNDHAPQVLALRDFRDKHLLNSIPGRWLVKQYYTYSPAAAHLLNRYPRLKPLVRAVLTPLVTIALFLDQADELAKTAMLLLLLCLVCSRYRRNYHSPGSAITSTE